MSLFRPFVAKTAKQAQPDAVVMEHVADLFAEKGADAWYDGDAASVLPKGTKCPSCSSQNLALDDSIVDVWFESGCSWLAVCQPREDLGDVDLYLEGSDQHRGWFHSSLLVGIGVAGKAPYKSVLTHGFCFGRQRCPLLQERHRKAKREGKKSKITSHQVMSSENSAPRFCVFGSRRQNSEMTSPTRKRFSRP